MDAKMGTIILRSMEIQTRQNELPGLIAKQTDNYSRAVLADEFTNNQRKLVALREQLATMV